MEVGLNALSGYQLLLRLGCTELLARREKIKVTRSFKYTHTSLLGATDVLSLSVVYGIDTFVTIFTVVNNRG